MGGSIKTKQAGPGAPIPILALALGLLAIIGFAAGVSSLPRRQRDAAEMVAHTLQVLVVASTLEADLATARLCAVAQIGRPG